MKNLLYYFYLLCFIALFFLGLAHFFIDDDYIGMALLFQLVWGPISIIHCLYKYVMTRQSNAVTARLYTYSLALTVIYFISLTLVGMTSLGNFGEYSETLFILGVGVVPWLMLAFFTYILHIEKGSPSVNLQQLEDDLIEENI